MGQLSVTSKNVSASQEQGAVIRRYQVAADITDAPGKGVYIKSDETIDLADANLSLAGARGRGVIVNTSSIFGETNVKAGDWVAVCVYGPTYGWDNLTPGVYGWVGTTPGVLEDAAPSTAYQHIMGQADAADVFFVNPGISSPVSA